MAAREDGDWRHTLHGGRGVGAVDDQWHHSLEGGESSARRWSSRDWVDCSTVRPGAGMRHSSSRRIVGDRTSAPMKMDARSTRDEYRGPSTISGPRTRPLPVARAAG